MAKGPDNRRPEHDRREGLSLGATVGIAISVALAVILGALAAWILVRHRRRRWGKKHKEQKFVDPDGETPDEEIARKVEDSRAKEMEAGIVTSLAPGSEDIKSGGNQIRAAVNGEIETKRRPISELYTESNAHEMPGGVRQLAGIDEGKTFIAELDGTDIPGRKALTQELKEEDAMTPKPLDIRKKTEDAALEERE